MSSSITKAIAYTNGEIAYLSWEISGMIKGCLGFEITRLYPDDPENNVVLPAWVAFKGQVNKDWKPQNTSVWPIQKLNWRDLTLRRSRNSLVRHPEEVGGKPVRVRYLIRPVVAYQAGLQAVNPDLPVTYTGAPVKLSYLDEGLTTNIFEVGVQYGSVRATFTNGILSTQWLTHTLQEQKATYSSIRAAINDPKSDIRAYLTGDVLDSLTMLMNRAKANPKATLKMALYELDDDELIQSILANKSKVEIVLSNTSLNKTKGWDAENAPAREKLKTSGVKIYDRMFNNNGHIGHNKFVVYLENGKPLSVLTGSTNWTPNGLCAQSNNAVVVDSPELAKHYNDYFERLKKDNAGFTVPDPLSVGTNNVQGAAFRSSNMPPTAPVVLADGTQLTVWFSPNTVEKAPVKTKTPPDLAQVYSLMRKAEKAIFFAVFLPGLSNDTSSDVMTNIITEAISIGQKDSSLLVYGSISSPMAMPNYEQGKPTAPIFEQGHLHVVQAVAITQNDIIGDFEAELLSAGQAIIHDKIVVIDPFSENAIAVFGSHNAGFKASYGNDENLIIVQNNPALVQAYAVHVLDIYEHYHTRAVLQEQQASGKQPWDGYLSTEDSWLSYSLSHKTDLSDYMCGKPIAATTPVSTPVKATPQIKAVKKRAVKSATKKRSAPAGKKKIARKRAAKNAVAKKVVTKKAVKKKSVKKVARKIKSRKK
ncbi:hypothetical protein A4D02_05265 [Niastella koreensis]|uniref:phospholipase D n=2 Tax=Niastella koreensis TaxID=354356 RepID=G8TC94_NIAKG|nr:phospholipase D-like domain-containing protein [Niastella koreensis]AEW01401.1 hypothetical protein Niako_5162 [Niastella koreensis GR20-10]OQP48134.1 hypothetical protein A4D02_05265 [Niastella koreensis]